MTAKHKTKNTPLVLVILDGWGISNVRKGNAIAQGKTPVLDSIYKKYPHIAIGASSVDVGLPKGQPGNSEAGHMNIGAGRVVEQDAVIISKAISNGTFFKNLAFIEAARHASKRNSDIHLMGLLSDGSSPHADNDHLLALLSFFMSRTDKKIYLHIFTDGRDSPRFAALRIMSQYKNIFDSERVKVVTVMGRFYGMDRKMSWSRTKKAYEALVLGKGQRVKDGIEAVNQAYNRGESDEFIKPSVVTKKAKAIGRIGKNDSLVFFNLRSDRARQLAKVFGQDDFEKKNRNAFKRERFPKSLFFVALTDFGPDLENVITAYPGIDIPETLPFTLKDLRQLYIAELEKYAHISYFINGGYDHPVAGELRIKIRSKEVDPNNDNPAMSTTEITNYVLATIREDKYDFITVNYAGPDMISHTGNLKAGIKAVEAIDATIKRLTEVVLAKQGTVVITADHGNLEEMLNLKTSEIDTQHSINPVPFIIVSPRKYKLKKSGKLANVAPTILDILGVPQPELMTAKSLIKK